MAEVETPEQRPAAQDGLHGLPGLSFRQTHGGWERWNGCCPGSDIAGGAMELPVFPSFFICHSSSSNQTAVLWTRRFLLCWWHPPPCMLWASAAAVCAANGDKGPVFPHRLWTGCPVMPDLSPGCRLGAANSAFRNSPCATVAVSRGCSVGCPPLKNHFGVLQGRRKGLAPHRQGHTACNVPAGPAAGRQHSVVRKRRGCCSLRSLYLNSSSSRARRFCGQAVFCGVTVVCSASKSGAGACCRCGRP